MNSCPVWSLPTIDVCPVTKVSSTTSDTGEYSVTMRRWYGGCGIIFPPPHSLTRAPGLMFYCVSRIHIKESHEGVEPKENFSPELFANADDFVCLICVKKYNGRQNLKNHLVKTHLGLENGKDATKDNSESVTTSNEATEKPDFEDLDPLTEAKDELTDVNGDNSVADISRESADIQEVDIESIKNKNGSQNGNDSSDKENNFIGEGEETGTEKSESVKSRSESKILTDREKELLEKMFHNLKKFGCAFCKER